MHDFLHPLVLLHELNPLVLLSHLLFRLAVISSVDSVAASSPSRHTRQIILMVVYLALSLQDCMESTIGRTPAVAPPHHQLPLLSPHQVKWWHKFCESLSTPAPPLLSSDQCLTLVSHPPQHSSVTATLPWLIYFNPLHFHSEKLALEVRNKSTNLILHPLLFLSTIMWISELI